jgi:hypothetical protein
MVAPARGPPLQSAEGATRPRIGLHAGISFHSPDGPLITVKTAQHGPLPPSPSRCRNAAMPLAATVVVSTAFCRHRDILSRGKRATLWNFRFAATFRRVENPRQIRKTFRTSKVD